MKSVNRQTKIIATVGPVTDSEEALRLLIKNGVDLFRLNMAHADHKWIQDVTRRIRKTGKELNREPAIMMDVKGPEIRTGYLHKEINLKKGDLLELVFVAQPNPPIKDKIWQIEVNYDRLPEHIKEGM